MTRVDREQTAAPQTLRVPRQDHSWFQRPALNSACEWLQSNADLLSDAQLELHGRPLAELRHWTRTAVWQAAQAFTGQWTELTAPAPTRETRWVVGGHQPALFHPGVWAKNFAIGKLGRLVEGVSLNLVVDIDTLTSHAIRVPVGTVDAPSTEQIPIDSTTPQQPWEEVRIQDPDLFRSFGQRVESTLADWNYTPFLHEFWPDVVELSDRFPRVADSFTAARNRWERAWGSHNLELPLSQVCQLPPFFWFTTHLLAELPRFQHIYNGAVRAYRQRNGLKSTSHPVPELVEQAGWQEAPFWIWRAGDRRRSRLFARATGSKIELSMDARETLISFPLAWLDQAAPHEPNPLQRLSELGLHLRTRALTTTLFNRIFLADLFVHGIGGAKYDEITDDLIREFYQLPVPRYSTVSGTLHLPLGKHAASAENLFQARRQLRDLHWNPTTALQEHPHGEVQALRQQFAKTLQQPVSDRASRRQRHRALVALKTELQPWISPEIPAAENQLRTVQHQLAANQILTDREYSFVLYPMEKLREFLTAVPVQA